MASDSNTFRPAPFLEPVVKGSALRLAASPGPHSLTVFVSTAVNMIETEEFRTRLTAAEADSSVVVDGF